MAFSLATFEAQTVSLIANSNYFLKKSIQVLPSLRADLKIHETQLLRLASAFLIAHLPLFNEIDLIANQDGESVASFIIIVEMQPSFCTIEGYPAADIEDNQRAMRILKVSWYQRFEALLSCRVPNLQAIRLVAYRHLLRQKIDSHCRLNGSLVTLAPSLKRSLTYRSIMQDLPTDWQPKRTILSLSLPETVLIELFMIIIALRLDLNKVWNQSAHSSLASWT